MRALAAGVVAIGVAVTGCSVDGTTTAATPPPNASVSTSPASPASTPDGAPVTARVPTPPRGGNDAAGREDFAEYVLQAWIHSLNTNDAGPLIEASGPTPCAGCGDLAAELRARADEGWHVGLSDVRVSSATQQASGRSATVALSVAIPESASYHADGSYRSSNPAHPRSTFTVEMTHTGDGFRLVSFSLS